MKRATNISLGLVILVAILASSHHSSKLANAQTSNPNKQQALSAAISKRAITSEIAANDSNVSFENRFQQEALRVGKIDDGTIDLNKEISTWANQLNEADLKSLMAKSLNSTEAGDERGLAIFALTKSTSVTSVDLLAQVALSEISKDLNPKVFELEQVIRGMAVEGILNSPHRDIAEKSLNKISSQSADSFVVDRSNRALHFIKSGGKTPEQQDLAALEALLKSPL